MNIFDTNSELDSELKEVIAKYGTLNPFFHQDELGVLQTPMVRRLVAGLSNKALTAHEKKIGLEPEFTEPLNDSVAFRRIKSFIYATRAQIDHVLSFPESLAAPVDANEWRESQRSLPKSIQEVLTPFYARRVYPADDGYEAMFQIEIDHTRTARICEILDIQIEGKNPLEKVRGRIEKNKVLRSRLHELTPFNSLHGEDTARHNLRICAIIPEIWEDGTKPSKAGYLLGTQRTAQNREVFFLTTLTDALRRAEHILESYKNEVTVLQEVKSLLNELSSSIGNTEKRFTQNDLEEVRRRMGDILMKLRDSNDGKKKAVIEYTDRAMNLKMVHAKTKREDITFAPSTMLQNLAEGKGPLVERIHAVERISGYIAKDVMALRGIKAGNERPFIDFIKAVEEGDANFALTDINKPLTIDYICAVINRIDERAKAFSHLHHAPYLAFKKAFDDHVLKFKQRLGALKGNLSNHALREEAIKEYIKLYSITKLKRVHSRINDIYDLLNDDVDFAKVVESLQDAKKEFKEINVSPEIRMMDYSDQFQSIYCFLDDLVSTLCEELGVDSNRELEGQSMKILSDYQRGAMSEQLRDKIRTIDFDEILTHIDDKNVKEVKHTETM